MTRFAPTPLALAVVVWIGESATTDLLVSCLAA